ncbi:MAG TPA: glycosyltransferase family 39 protein [Candidatus Eisenbacteria bacterium]
MSAAKGKRPHASRHVPHHGPHHAPRHDARAREGGATTRWTRWIAYAAIALFGIYWLVQGFSAHGIGNYGVETDFYWKYGPAARDLARGHVDAQYYDSKGWGYPAAVALLALSGFEPFRAGQVIALLAALVSLLLLYRLHRSLFGPGAALAGVLLVAGNGVFLANTYEVGTDMFFLAVALASVALLLRSKEPGALAVLASGLLGGWAFSTRYNGLFLLPGALALFLVYRVPQGPMGAAWRRAAIWTGGFVAGALPWLVINAVHTGNPLTNSNYVNVGYAVYGEGNWEKFFYGGGRSVHSFADVVLLDPGRFVVAMVKNVFDHVRRDLFELLSPPWGAAAIGGALLLLKDRPDRRVLGYLTFGALGFLSLVPVFYGARFSLPLLPFYAALVTWPLVSPTAGRALAGLERAFPLRSFVFLLLWVPIAFSAYVWTGDSANPEAVRIGPYDLTQAIGFLKQRATPGEGLLARKPHAAFLADLRFVPIPDVANSDSLHAVAERERARYLLVSGAELSLRAAIRPFAAPDAAIPGFTRIFESPGALVYEVVPIAPKPDRP